MFPNRVILDYGTTRKAYIPEGVPQPPTGIQYYRVKHDNPLTRLNLPEVFPLFPNHFCEFGKSWQLLERQLNATMTNQKWRALHGWKTGFNNRNGYENPDDIRADFVNMLDILRPNPKQEALICGGAILRGKEEGINLIVETLNVDSEITSLNTLKPGDYFDAVTTRYDANKNAVVGRFPQGMGERVYILLLADRTHYPKITFPLSMLEKLPIGQPLPSPYRYP